MLRAVSELVPYRKPLEFIIIVFLHMITPQVVDALMPQVLTLTAGVPLDEAMRAFRFTRSDFAIVVEPARETGATHEAMSNIQTFSAEVRAGRAARDGLPGPG